MIRTAIAFLLLSGLLAGCSSGGNAEGDKAPAFSVEKLEKEGEVVSLADLKGKVVLLDFWATWCGPCRETMPDIQNIYNSYKGNGLVVMAISNETRSEINAFKAKESFTYPMYVDTDNSANTSFNIVTIPHAVVIGKNGKILYQGLPIFKDLVQAIDKGLAQE
jgi:peroxiredoxin